jgi:protein-disulfide isomerase
MFARTLSAAFLFATMAFASVPVAAQPAPSFTPQQRAEIVAVVREALQKDPSILRDAVIALQADDGHRQTQQQASTVAVLASQIAHTPGDPVAGNPNGKITVVEFFDVRCPFCRRMLPVVASLLHDNPDVRLVYKDLPVLGPGSVLGARALLAAQKQGGYQKLHDALMTGPRDITEDSLHTAVAKVGLDWKKIQADMQSPDVLARIDSNLALAKQLNLEGTPAYVIGTNVIPGAVSLTELQQAVTEAKN